jgi:DNA invertase Pin-like site-specific DNA recombinase
MTTAAVYGRNSHGEEASIEDQLDLGISAAEEQGWSLTGAYSDKVSASRYGTKIRGGWAELLAAEFDVLVLWDSSRGSREPIEWLTFLADCRAAGRQIHVISHDRTYNPKNKRDWKTLADDGIKSAYDSEEIADKSRRGHARRAKKGQPSSKTPVGYRRVYGEDGRATYAIEPTEAERVREIFRRAAKSEPLHRIAADYGITRMQVRRIALNPAYIGLRLHHGSTYPGTWEPIVTEAEFYAAARVLNEPSRLAGARPGRQVHLLSYLAICGCGCGGQVVPRPNTTYGCPAGHMSIGREPVDELVTELAVARLSSPDLYRELEQATDAADETLRAARETVDTLTGQLEDWRKSAWDGRGTTPETLAGPRSRRTWTAGSVGPRRTSAPGGPLRRSLRAGPCCGRWGSG